MRGESIKMGSYDTAEAAAAVYAKKYLSVYGTVPPPGRFTYVPHAARTPKQATPACSLAGLDNDVLKLIGERVVVEWDSSEEHEGYAKCQIQLLTVMSPSFQPSTSQIGDHWLRCYFA